MKPLYTLDQPLINPSSIQRLNMNISMRLQETITLYNIYILLYERFRGMCHHRCSLVVTMMSFFC